MWCVRERRGGEGVEMGTRVKGGVECVLQCIYCSCWRVVLSIVDAGVEIGRTRCVLDLGWGFNIMYEAFFREPTFRDH